MDIVLTSQPDSWLDGIGASWDVPSPRHSSPSARGLPPPDPTGLASRPGQDGSGRPADAPHDQVAGTRRRANDRRLHRQPPVLVVGHSAGVHSRVASPRSRSEGFLRSPVHLGRRSCRRRSGRRPHGRGQVPVRPAEIDASRASSIAQCHTIAGTEPPRLPVVLAETPSERVRRAGCRCRGCAVTRRSAARRPRLARNLRAVGTLRVDLVDRRQRGVWSGGGRLDRRSAAGEPIADREDSADLKARIADGLQRTQRRAPGRDSVLDQHASLVGLQWRSFDPAGEPVLLRFLAARRRP